MPFIFSPLPHTDAVKRIAGLPLVSREVMDGLLPELRAYAFCVTGLDSFDQLAKVRDHIQAVPAGAQTWAKARKGSLLSWSMTWAARPASAARSCCCVRTSSAATPPRATAT